VAEILRNLGVYYNSIIYYWELELDRIKDMLTFPGARIKPAKFREAVIRDLRFS
jgi:hypothetical protein